MNKAIIGIDPGLTGGLCLIHDNSVMVVPMPVDNRNIDIVKLNGLINGWLQADPYLPPIHTVAYIEKLWGVPGWDSTKLFKYAGSYWIPTALLKSKHIEVVDVAAKTWRKSVLGNIDATKKDAIEFCISAGLDIGKHDGMAEAACIAEYGRRKENGSD